MNGKSPWSWIPTLYFNEALPNAVVSTIAVLLYKELGCSNSAAAFFTAMLYFPWVIKPFISPFIDLYRTQRWWIISMQLIMAMGFIAIGTLIPTSHYLAGTLSVFALIAFLSSTHDIAADGFYMAALNQHDQTFYSGIRNTFYRIAANFSFLFIGWLAGYMESCGSTTPDAWSFAFYIFAVIFLLITIYNYFLLPRITVSTNGKETAPSHFWNDFRMVLSTFFQKKGAVKAIIFLLLFRFPEAQITKITSLFLRDSTANGGLALSIQQISVLQSIVGAIGLTLGGILGGMLAAKDGLKHWLWMMVAAITLPDIVYVYLSYMQPVSLYTIGSCLFIEQFGYGFGFAAYMLFMIYFSQGKHATAHYAICTSFMAIGMMLPGMMAGWIQEKLQYPHFFLWIIISCAVTFGVTALIKIDPKFGIKGK